MPVNVISVAFQGGGDGAFTRRCELFAGLLKRGSGVVHLGPLSAKLEELRRRSPLSNLAIFALPEHQRPALTAIPAYARAVAQALPNADVVVAFSELEVLTVELAFRFASRRLPSVFIPRASAAQKAKFAAEFERSRLRRVATTLNAHIIDNAVRFAHKWSCAVVQTPFQRDYIRTRCPSLPLVLVPNNINPSWITEQHTADVPDDIQCTLPIRDSSRSEPVILSIANQYLHAKGLDFLLQALRCLPTEIPWRALLIGDGPDAGQVRREIVSKGLSDRVHHLGHLPNAHRLMRSQPIVVSYARLDDCPNVILEALYYRCPLLASDIPAHRFLLGNASSGLAPLAISKIAAQLENTLQNASARAALISEQEAARERFNFDWQATMVDIVVNSSRRPPLFASQGTSW